MMMLVETELVGRVERWRDRPRKKDRLPAVRYGRSPNNRYRKEPRPGQWVPTLMETWALENRRCIGESLLDDLADLQLPPHARPMLVRVGMHAALDLLGGVLIERLDDLGDALAKAIFCRFLSLSHTEIWYGKRWPAPGGRVQARHVTDKEIAGWTEARSAAVEAGLDKFRHAVHEAAALEIQRTDSLFHLGSGPARDVDLARAEDRRLSASNTDADIRRYLEVYGYINPSGTVGRWSHEQLQALRLDAAD